MPIVNLPGPDYAADMAIAEEVHAMAAELAKIMDRAKAQGLDIDVWFKADHLDLTSMADRERIVHDAFVPQVEIKRPISSPT